MNKFVFTVSKFADIFTKHGYTCFNFNCYDNSKLIIYVYPGCSEYFIHKDRCGEIYYE